MHLFIPFVWKKWQEVKICILKGEWLGQLVRGLEGRKKGNSGERPMDGLRGMGMKHKDFCNTC